MKKAYIILMIFVLSLTLCACDVGKTQEWRTFTKIYINFEKGDKFTKETLVSTVENPDYPAVENIYDESTAVWQYIFYELIDPANPYKLVV